MELKQVVIFNTYNPYSRNVIIYTIEYSKENNTVAWFQNGEINAIKL